MSNLNQIFAPTFKNRYDMTVNANELVCSIRDWELCAAEKMRRACNASFIMALGHAMNASERVQGLLGKTDNYSPKLGEAIEGLLGSLIILKIFEYEDGEDEKLDSAIKYCKSAICRFHAMDEAAKHTELEETIKELPIVDGIDCGVCF